jgi:peptidoglycan-N-acetylglucosamine deacetylase
MKKHNLSKTFIITLVFSLIADISASQSYPTGTIFNKSDFQWPDGKKMALSLTFDDARLSQVDKGIPLLDKYGVKATFYLLPDNMLQRLEGWKKAVSNGHEIGNHSLVHPCTGNFDWSRDKALEDYTLLKMNVELDSANNILDKTLGIRPVSFAFPCGQKFVGRGEMTKSYIPVIAAKFESGRGWLDEGPNDPAFCDLSQLTGMELDGKSFEQIKNLIESAKSKGQWLILAGHEMNEGGIQTSLLSTIEAICKYASDPANDIWIDKVHNIAAYIKEKRGEK